MIDIRKLKVGDKVMVRPDLIDGGEYDGVLAIDGMLDYKGKVMTIKEIRFDISQFSDNYVDVVTFQEDDGDYLWTSDMLIPDNDASMKSTRNLKREE